VKSLTVTCLMLWIKDLHVYLHGAPLNTSYIVSPSKNIRPLKRHGAIDGIGGRVVGSGLVGVELCVGGTIVVGLGLHTKSFMVTIFTISVWTWQM